MRDWLLTLLAVSVPYLIAMAIATLVLALSRRSTASAPVLRVAEASAVWLRRQVGLGGGLGRVADGGDRTGPQRFGLHHGRSRCVHLGPRLGRPCAARSIDADHPAKEGAPAPAPAASPGRRLRARHAARISTGTVLPCVPKDTRPVGETRRRRHGRNPSGWHDGGLRAGACRACARGAAAGRGDGLRSAEAGLRAPDPRRRQRLPPSHTSAGGPGSAPRPGTHPARPSRLVHPAQCGRGTPSRGVPWKEVFKRYGAAHTGDRSRSVSRSEARRVPHPVRPPDAAPARVQGRRGLPCPCRGSGTVPASDA
jgi:hypothetical protein